MTTTQIDTIARNCKLTDSQREDIEIAAEFARILARKATLLTSATCTESRRERIRQELLELAAQFQPQAPQPATPPPPAPTQQQPQPELLQQLLAMLTQQQPPAPPTQPATQGGPPAAAVQPATVPPAQQNNRFDLPDAWLSANGYAANRRGTRPFCLLSVNTSSKGELWANVGKNGSSKLSVGGPINEVRQFLRNAEAWLYWLDEAERSLK